MPRILALLLCLSPWEAAALEARPDLARVEQVIVKETNDFRREHKRGIVARHEKLEAAAREFAKFMASTGKYSHEADGRRPQERIVDQGYRYCRFGENISYQFSSVGFETAELASRLVEGWKHSPGHRRNMLEPDAVHTGVAVARSPTTGHFYAVQIFAAPRKPGGGC